MNDSEWTAFCQSVREIQQCEFMKEMEERLRTIGTKSSMGLFDSAVLLALVRKYRGMELSHVVVANARRCQGVRVKGRFRGRSGTLAGGNGSSLGRSPRSSVRVAWHIPRCF